MKVRYYLTLDVETPDLIEGNLDVDMWLSIMNTIEKTEIGQTQFIKIDYDGFRGGVEE